MRSSARACASRFTGEYQDGGGHGPLPSHLLASRPPFFREDNGQSDPGITSLYDFPTNDPTYTAIGGAEFGYLGDIGFLGSLGEGRLPLDRPHAFKVFGNYAFENGLGIGIGMVMNSGKPLTALASLPPYDNSSEIPLTPRGEGFETIDGFKERTPFEYQLDLQASYVLRFGGRQLTLLADAFNLFQSAPHARLQRGGGNQLRQRQSRLRHADVGQRVWTTVPSAVLATHRRAVRVLGHEAHEDGSPRRARRTRRYIVLSERILRALRVLRGNRSS